MIWTNNIQTFTPESGSYITKFISCKQRDNFFICSIIFYHAICNLGAPNHDGLCTANIAEDAVLGNETVYSKKCAVEVSDYLKISHIATDGDSKAFRGIKEIHGPNVTSLRDVRHLAGSLKRAILKCTFSESLFSGINKLNKKNRFALDIKARCVAELYQSFQVHNGELYKIKEQMPCIIETS
jgi:hypothetical protein